MGGADGRWAGSRWPLVGGAVAGPPKNLTQDTQMCTPELLLTQDVACSRDHHATISHCMNNRVANTT